MTKPVIVFTHGVFDLMHSNHVQALEEAAGFGDRLVVGVHADKVVEGYKRTPVLNEEERLAQVRALACVDEAFIDHMPHTAEGMEASYQRVRPDHYVYFGDGYDDVFAPWIRRDLLRRLPYHDGISTSRIIETIRARFARGDL